MWLLGSSLVLMWFFPVFPWNVAGNLEDLFLFHPNLGLILGKDSMLECQNGFSFPKFHVPVGFFLLFFLRGFGIVQVQSCSRSSIQIFQTSSRSPFSREKKKKKREIKEKKNLNETENSRLGIVEFCPGKENVWEWWRRGEFGKKSWVYSCCWIPFGIRDSLRPLGSPWGFWNP